jgi:cytidylate kinase
MYRAFTLAALRLDIPPSQVERCTTLAKLLGLHLEGSGEPRIMLGAEDVTDLLRAPDVEANVSPYSAIQGVRDVLVRLQREFASNGQTVLAGRDIGTVVLPRAPVRIFLDASEEARAARRSEQAAGWGIAQDALGARQDIAGRDRLDSRRNVQAATGGAIVIDTTDLTLEQTVARALEIVECWRG